MSKSTKRKIAGVMKVNVGTVLDECIESGCELGWARAHKHTDNPDKDTLLDCIQQCIFEHLSEHFTWV